MADGGRRSAAHVCVVPQDEFIFAPTFQGVDAAQFTLRIYV